MIEDTNESKVISAVFFFIDLRGSREVFNDQTNSTKILKLLEKYLNKSYTSRLMTPFSIREGDALIGGTTDVELLVDIYQTCLNFGYSKELLNLTETMDVSREKIKFYFGVGIGEITTPAYTYINIEEINGTAISNAKEAAEKAKKAIKSNDDYYFKLQNFQFYVQSDSKDPKSRIINPMMYLIFEKLVGSSRQNELFILKNLYHEDKNYDLANKMGYEFDRNNVEERRKISSQISNIIRKSNYELQKNAKIDLKKYLYDNYTLGGRNK